MANKYKNAERVGSYEEIKKEIEEMQKNKET
jgi:hypothetical protein